MLGAGDPASARKHDFNDVEANSGYAASGKLHSRELHPRERNSARGAAQRPPKTRPKSPAHNQAAPQKVLRSFNTWAFKREQPDDPQLMLQVIADAIGRRAPVPFVLYWGKGPRCGLAEPDIECLDFLTAFAARVREAHAPGATLRLIFTDTHAELNGHPRETIRRYFDEIEGAARKRRGGDARARQPRPSRAAPEAQSGFLEVEAVGAAEALKQIDVGTGPAPAVDDAQVASASGEAFEQRRDEPAKSAEPEVRRLGVEPGY